MFKTDKKRDHVFNCATTYQGCFKNDEVLQHGLKFQKSRRVYCMLCFNLLLLGVKQRTL